MKNILIFLSASLLTCCQTRDRSTIAKLKLEAFKADSLNNFTNSIELYTRILSLDASDITALTNRGRAKINLRDTASGLIDLDKAISIEPWPPTLLSKGIVVGQKEPLKGLKYIHHALQIDKEYVAAYNTLVYFYSVAIPLKDSALFYATLISQKGWEDNLTLETLADAYLANEEPELLLKATTRLIKAEPGNPYAYNNRGYAKLKLGDLHSAQQDILKSLSLDSGNSFAYKNLGLVFIEKKQPDSICFYLNKASQKGFKKKFGNEVDSLLDRYCR
jgi:hypothetical protein